MSEPIKVIVIGCGNMGSSHARSYHKSPGFKLVGLVDQNPENREKLSDELGGIRQFDDVDTAIAATRPDAVAVCTYPGTHATLYDQKPLNQALMYLLKNHWQCLWRRLSIS